MSEQLATPTSRTTATPATRVLGSITFVGLVVLTVLALVVSPADVNQGESVRMLYLHAPTPLLGQLADDMRARKHPDRTVTYIIDRNVNYTNVCVARCNFCAFYRPVG